jgi:hypothetical protein
MAVSFIGGGNQSTRRKTPTCRKSQTNFELMKSVKNLITSIVMSFTIIFKEWRVMNNVDRGRVIVLFVL